MSKGRLNERRVDILWTLQWFARKNHKLTIRELGKIIKLSPSIITRQLKSLEKEGFVKKSISSDDERNKIVELTDKGAKVLQKEKNRRKKWFEKALSDLSGKERKAFVGMWQKIVRAIEY
jgi:DNA-binding MarR family transcriptional regulator